MNTYPIYRQFLEPTDEVNRNGDTIFKIDFEHRGNVVAENATDAIGKARDRGWFAPIVGPAL